MRFSSGHKVSPFGDTPTGPQIPIFDREYVENGKSQRCVSMGVTMARREPPKNVKHGTAPREIPHKEIYVALAYLLPGDRYLVPIGVKICLTRRALSCMCVSPLLVAISRPIS